MKRLIEQTTCPHGEFVLPGKHYVEGDPCPGGTSGPPDFDAIWRRYYETADRRFKEGLTYNELWFVVYGEKKEEE